MLLDLHFTFSVGSHADRKVDLRDTIKLQSLMLSAPKAERMSRLHTDVSRTSSRLVQVTR
jgi:hypothetical protein